VLLFRGLLSPADTLAVSVALAPLRGLAPLRCNIDHDFSVLAPDGDTLKAKPDFHSHRRGSCLTRRLGLHLGGISGVKATTALANERRFVKHCDYWFIGAWSLCG